MLFVLAARREAPAQLVSVTKHGVAQLFRLSVDEEFDALMRDHGLEQRTVETIAFTHRVANADELWEGLLGGTVRTSALIERQPDETRRRIRDSFNRLVRQYQRDAVLELPVSAKLASARKPHPD